MWRSRLHHEAEVEFDEALDWYAERDPTAATRFAANAQRTLNSISTDPTRYATIASEIYAATIPDFPYQIVFRVHEDFFEVLAFHHASRRSGYWTDRLGL